MFFLTIVSITFLSQFHGTRAAPPTSSSIVGQRCTLSDPSNTEGICMSLQDCDYAISNFRAGVDPKLCTAIQKKTVIVCCPTQDRISVKKCREYEKVKKEERKIMPLSAFALRSGDLEQDSEPEEYTDDYAEDDSEQTLRRFSTLPNKKKCEVQPTAFITGGRDAKADEFPFMVALGYGEIRDRRWDCGGTLISEDFILTAAHCINTAGGKPRRVFLGNINLHDPSTNNNSSRKSLAMVTEAIVHPGYSKPIKYNDIALLRLSKKLKLSKSILPACLPPPNLRLENVKPGRVAGWGRLMTGGERANTLQVARLERMAQNSCVELYDQKSEKEFYFPQGILRSQFCAGDTEKDTCKGDSGGPYAVKVNNTCMDYVVGVTSFGSVFCGFGEPGIYTNVQSHLDWIEATVWPQRK